VVRRKSAPRAEPVQATEDAPQPAAITPVAPTANSAATDEEAAEKIPAAQPEAVASLPADEAASAGNVATESAGEPERAAPAPPALPEDTPSSPTSAASSSIPEELAEPEEASFFDNITDFLKTNLDPETEPAVETESPAVEVEAAKPDTPEPVVEIAPRETVASEPARPVSEADAMASSNPPVVEKPKTLKSAGVAKATLEPAPVSPALAEPTEIAETDITEEAAKSVISSPRVSWANRNCRRL